MKKSIQVISAPSILGLKPSGVEHLSEALLASGLLDHLKAVNPVIPVPARNDAYSFERDSKTDCLNPVPIRAFSLALLEQLSGQLQEDTFPMVLGGDCSILLGIMPALKKKGRFGLLFLDAHADFYAPSQSSTGEVADMDLAIITGRGPEVLTNIEGLKPYVKDDDVLHIGQRDAEEAKKYGSPDIRDTSIKCFDLDSIRLKGLNKTIDDILEFIKAKALPGFWLHFDTDVLNDEENPAVDYRLPGGLWISEVECLLSKLLETGRIAGMSVSIFNPKLDTEHRIAKRITTCLGNALKPSRPLPALASSG